MPAPLPWPSWENCRNQKQRRKANMNAVANNPNKDNERTTYNDYGYIQHFKETTHALDLTTASFLSKKTNHTEGN